MKFEERVPKQLFNENNHYNGRPADFGDKIINRRISILENVNKFIDKDLELLDIGCGNGATMLLLSNKMKSCHGIEIDEQHLEEFEKNKSDLNISNCSYSIANVLKDTPEKQYDRVISFEVIEHLENESGLKYYHNSLKKGGLIAITVPNKWWIFETHGAKLPFLPWNRVPFFSWLPTCFHERYANARIYTKSRIKQLMESFGFEVIKMEYITAPLDVIPQSRFKEIITRYFFNENTTKIPFKSVSIFLLARKKENI